LKKDIRCKARHFVVRIHHQFPNIKKNAMKIGLFYGSTTCYTEMAAEKIRAIIGEDLIDIHNVKESPLSLMADYDFLILGISTWDFGEIQEDWNELWDQINSLPLTGKTVALFGLGDQEGYGEWYLDAMGFLHDEVQKAGANVVGYWPNDENYQFEASKALTEDKTQFVGLALDEDSQYELSDERIATWVEQILVEYQETL
jgi:flavodoxin II